MSLNLQNARVTAFTVSELLRENQQGGWGGVQLPHPPPRLGLNEASDSKFVTRKWNIVNDLSNTNCDVANEIISKQNC